MHHPLKRTTESQKCRMSSCVARYLVTSEKLTKILQLRPSKAQARGQKVVLTASVMSRLTTAVVLKDGEPRSLAWITRDHLQSFSWVMFCTISMDLMYGFSLISPVSALISKASSGSAVMMEYSMTLFGDSASSSNACMGKKNHEMVQILSSRNKQVSLERINNRESNVFQYSTVSQVHI